MNPTQQTDVFSVKQSSHNNRFFLYSYSKQPDNNVDETMVFRCDEQGDHDGRELFFGHGYIHSKDAMIGTQANLASKNSNYALDA